MYTSTVAIKNDYQKSVILNNNQTLLCSPQSLNFPKGIPGFLNCYRFILQDFDSQLYKPLKILMCFDRPEINLLLYPHLEQINLLSPEAIQELNFYYNLEDCKIYSIVTVKKIRNELSLSTNLRAPVVVDNESNQGWQHILAYKDLSYTYPLTELSQIIQARRHNGSGL